MAGTVQEMRDQLDESLHDSSKPWTPTLALIEQRTGIGRLYIFVGTIVVIGLWLVFGYAAQLVCNTLGFLYPAYASMRDIESETKDDDARWMTYWVVFALFSVTEYFADFVVGWFPLYWLVKCIFLIWLMIPTEFNGALIIYSRVIRPYCLHLHGETDKTKESVNKND